METITISSLLYNFAHLNQQVCYNKYNKTDKNPTKRGPSPRLCQYMGSLAVQCLNIRKMKSIVVNGPYWIGYADEESVANKVRYANFLDIAGVMVWSIDTDNFRGEWNQKKFPLLHSIQDTLNSGETLDPSNPKCSGTAPMCDVEPTTPTPTPTTTPVTSPTTSSPFDPSQCTEVNDVIPYPGDCHRYLMCLDNGQGGYNLQVN